MKAIVRIRRRESIADPEGSTIRRALGDLGFTDVQAVRVNRTIELDLQGLDREEAISQAREMCDRLLVNPVMEDFDIEIVT
ncbi:phosphoribosylformylglycinamidine synthase subunit PurS [bacterium BMS3Abin02]|nr:phosphoribosylformylglycinamidine synthase subunit PurS [bacterium BMS3Abin02]GBE23410.1 phosphoribosylformylglycinamidine synthase subunit PurS [bacterium BMS3Bbin01]